MLESFLSCLLPVFLLFGLTGALLAAIRSSDALDLALLIRHPTTRATCPLETKVRFSIVGNVGW